MTLPKNKKLQENPFVKKNKKWWLILTAIFLFLIFIAGGSTLTFTNIYADKFYPGVKIGNLDVAGQTKQQVLPQLKAIEQNISTNGLSFNYQNNNVTINSIMLSADPDLSQQILYFDWEKTVNQAYDNGRDANFVKDFLDIVSAALSGKKFGVNYWLNEPELLNILRANFANREKQPVNAQLQISGDSVNVTGEQSGYVFDYGKAISALKQNINSLNFKPVTLDFNFKEPDIKKQDTAAAVASLDKVLAIESLPLTAEPNRWEIKKVDLVKWLEFQRLNDQVVVGLNKEKVFEFLKPIADQVNVEVKDGKMKIENDRVIEFQASADGKTLGLEASYQKINSQIMAAEVKPVELVVAVESARVKTADTDVTNLGIKELIGRGTSNFAGSPKNRRINIAVGAASLDGILIKPDEEFSLLKALGPVDGEHGYKQELVIKGNRTIPEYGGGLCQIGTTTFRAALRSGLPITARQNHTYRVVYYEPAGMDATIYNPAPDMKFINDTGHYILFTTKIYGDNVIFEFYGTKDGRKIEISPDPPSIFNISSPGEPRYIETTDLKPGEKKKVESAHKGADTYFKYTVTYSTGDVKVKEFSSHYVAWPEVWRIGVAPTPTSTDQTALGDTPPVTDIPAQ